MLSLRPSILAFADHLPRLDLPLERIDSWPSTLDAQSIDVLCVSAQKVFQIEFPLFFESLFQQQPQVQIVLIIDGSEKIEDLQSFCENYPVFRLVNHSELRTLENDLNFALEESQHLKQEKQLESLILEQNEKLQKLTDTLEEKVQKRQSFLLEARRKTHIANARWESLKEAMLAIFKASNISEMESLLLKSLEPTLQLGGIRIVIAPQDFIFNQQISFQKSLSFFSVPILKSDEKMGTSFFLRSREIPFQKEETDFLIRISEAISLAVDRQFKLEESLSLKEQWQATFNSVSEPVALINENFEIIQANSTFYQKNHQLSESSIGKKCFKVLFQRDKPCERCQLGRNFRIESESAKERSLYEVFSQQVPLDTHRSLTFVNLYQDVTEQTKIEKRILDSARLAEIGTIGSSIAHELNNPLGGILSFVQLIKMDMTKDHPYFEDIQSMEEGVLRCRDIVQNLLNFTRNPITDEEIQFDLKDVINRALKIVELQTRSRGIEIKLNLKSNEHPFFGHINILSQGFRNLLQVSIDSLIEKSKSQRGFQGFIEIYEIDSVQKYTFRILDNGLATAQSPHLGISIARQIFHDYGGELELSPPQQPLKWVQISLPRPVFPA